MKQWIIFNVICVSLCMTSPELLGQTSYKRYKEARELMILESVQNAGIKNTRVIDAMRTTERHLFVLPQDRAYAYQESALPIGYGQTISSPYVVASMTEALDPQPTDRVLEIGTGSGYQAAVLSKLVDKVYSIEIVEPLAKNASGTLKKLKYKNVFVKAGDGFKGWEQYAPYDKIILTCSPEVPPPALVNQLKEGGIMVIPMGERYAQTLSVLHKKDGEMKRQDLRPILFVPMTGEAESRREILPDASRPVLLNGDFEQMLPKTNDPAVWCYLYQASLVKEDTAPSGTHYLKLENTKPDRLARAAQGFGIDGRKVRRLNIFLWVKGEKLIPVVGAKRYPSIQVSFVDEKRNTIKNATVGNWLGSFGWKDVALTVDVPKEAREAILYVTMRGATGIMCVDQIEIEGVKEGKKGKPTAPNK